MSNFKPLFQISSVIQMLTCIVRFSYFSAVYRTKNTLLQNKLALLAAPSAKISLSAFQWVWVSHSRACQSDLGAGKGRGTDHHHGSGQAAQAYERQVLLDQPDLVL